MLMTKNPQELKDEILRRLGAPIINVEVTTDQVYDCINRALELYGEYHYNGLNKTYKVFYVNDDETYRNGVFDLKDESIFAVTQILRTNVGSITSLDGNATYPWVSDFILGMTSFNGNSCNSYGPNAFGADLSYYVQIMQYWGMLQNMMAPLPDYWFNEANAQLKVMGNFKKGDLIIIECFVKSFLPVQQAVGSYANYARAGVLVPDAPTASDIYNNPDKVLHNQYIAGQANGTQQGAYNNRWVKNYATTLTKELNGIILAKHQGLQLAGGTTIDGVRILNEAREEKANLEEELYLLSPPVPILIG